MGMTTMTAQQLLQAIEAMVTQGLSADVILKLLRKMNDNAPDDAAEQVAQDSARKAFKARFPNANRLHRGVA